MRIGRSGRIGAGRIWASWTWPYAPSNVTRSPWTSGTMIRSASSNRPTRWSNGIAERLVLGLVPAAAEAEDQPAAGDVVDRRGHLREEPGRPERRREDERPELDPARRRGERAEQRPRLVVARLGADRGVRRAVEEVVAEPEAVGAAVLGLAGEPEDLRPRPAGAVLRRLRQHQPDLHRPSLVAARRPVRAVPRLTGWGRWTPWRRCIRRTVGAAPTPAPAGVDPRPRPHRRLRQSRRSARCSATARSGCRPARA